MSNDQVVPTTYDQGVTNEPISKINTNYLALPISYRLGKVNAFRILINYKMDTPLKSNFSRCVRYLYRCGPAYVFRKVAGPGSGGALITRMDDITGFLSLYFLPIIGDTKAFIPYIINRLAAWKFVALRKSQNLRKDYFLRKKKA